MRQTIHRPTFSWLATFQLNLLIAVGVFLLLLAMNQIPFTTPFLIRSLFTTTLYTFCIGTPAFYVIARFIEPMPVQSETIVWSLVILFCVGLALIGTTVAEALLEILQLFRDRPFRLRFEDGLKLSIVVSCAAGIGRYAYDRMQKGLQRQNVELQRTIETGTARARLQEEDFQQARQIQAGLLPAQIVQLPGYQVSGAWQPALSVGGDYYHVIAFSDSRLGLVIADVVGKGVSAALLMANLQAAVRAFAANARPPAEVCTRVTEVMCSNVASGKFITMFYCVLDAAGRKITYCDAGHNSPILLRGNTSFRLEEGGGLLGVFRTWKYEQLTIDLQEGDRILMFTDGLSEAENIEGEQFGEERLIEVLHRFRSLPAHEIQARILEEVRDFCAGNFRDDATLLVIALP